MRRPLFSITHVGTPAPRGLPVALSCAFACSWTGNNSSTRLSALHTRDVAFQETSLIHSTRARARERERERGTCQHPRKVGCLHVRHQILHPKVKIMVTNGSSINHHLVQDRHHVLALGYRGEHARVERIAREDDLLYSIKEREEGAERRRMQVRLMMRIEIRVQL